MPQISKEEAHTLENITLLTTLLLIITHCHRDDHDHTLDVAHDPPPHPHRTLSSTLTSLTNLSPPSSRPVASLTGTLHHPTLAGVTTRTGHRVHPRKYPFQP